MKNVNVTTTILAMAFIGFTSVSCKESKNEENHDTMHLEMNHNDTAMAMDAMHSENKEVVVNESTVSNDNEVIALYLQVKDDLVAEDGKAAAVVSEKLVLALEKMDISKYNAEQQSKLKSIVTQAKEHAVQISKSEINKQRVHFKLLSNNMIDLVTITGTESTLYQQYCPMYDKGGSWLSASKDIRNPYFGSKMLACGRVEKEFN